MLAESQSPASIWFKISAPPLSSQSQRGALWKWREARRTHKRSRTRRGRARARESPPAARVDASTRRRVERPPETRARRASSVVTSPPRTRVDRDPAWRREVPPCSRRRRSLPRSRRARPRAVSSTCRLGRRGERARGRRGGRGSRNEPSWSVRRAGTNPATKTVPASVSRLSASACGVCCSGTWCARWTRCIFCARWSAARPRSRGAALEACARGIRSRWAPTRRREAPATKTRTTLPARLALVSQQKTSISWDVGRTDVRPSADTKELIRAVSLAESRPTARPSRGEETRAGSNLDPRDRGGGAHRWTRRDPTKPGGSHGGDGAGAGGKKHRGGRNAGGKGGGGGREGGCRRRLVGSSRVDADSSSSSFNPSTDLADRGSRRRTPSPPTDRATAKYRFASRTRTRIRSPVVRLARRPPPPRRLGTRSSPTPPNAPRRGGGRR